MDVIELARELGKAIQQDERFLAMQIARQNSDNDDERQHGNQNAPWDAIKDHVPLRFCKKFFHLCLVLFRKLFLCGRNVV